MATLVRKALVSWPQKTPSNVHVKSLHVLKQLAKALRTQSVPQLSQGLNNGQPGGAEQVVVDTADAVN